MYLLCVLALLILVWLGPALVIRPAWLRSSRTVVVIPIVSVAVIGVTKAILEGLGRYDIVTVRLLSIGIAVVAAARVVFWLRRRPVFHWPRNHVYLLVFALLLGVSWASRLGTTAFDTNDEIYSWNLWAMQHAMGEPVDWYYTHAPYPQLFAVLVSWMYQLLGDFELQLPLRASLAMIPVTLWGAVAVAAPQTDRASAWKSLGVMLLLAIAIGKWFGHGLADPLMAAALIVAIYCFLAWRAEPQRSEWLVLAVVCAAVAMYSKQPALLWGLFAFPLLVLLDVLRQRTPSVSLLAPVTTLALGLAWVFGAGSGFEQNQGVIDASTEGRAIPKQLVFASRELLLGEPLVLVLLLATTVAVVRERRHRDVFLLFVIPALLAWMLYGAYSLRLGIHVVACAALLLTTSGFALPSVLSDGATNLLGRSMASKQRGIAAGLVLLVLLGSAFQAYRKIERVGPTFSFYSGGANAVALYFGKDAETVLEETWKRPDRLLWVPSNYIFGLYYNRTPMVRPPRNVGCEYTSSVLLEELERTRPDFLFDVSEIDSTGDATRALRALATQDCPELFEAVATPPNLYGYTLYRLRDDVSAWSRCKALAGDAATGTP